MDDSRNDEVEALRNEVIRLSADLDASRRAAHRLQQIIDIAPIGLVRYDRTGGIEFLNQRVLDSAGASDVDDFARRAVELVHPDDIRESSLALSDALDGRSSRYNVRVGDGRGAWAHVEGTFFPITEAGEVDFVVSIFRDVTRQVEQTRAVARFKTIAEVTSDIVGIAGLDGEVVYLNPAGRAFMDLHGEHPRNLARFFDHIPQEYHKRLLVDALAAVTSGEVWQGEVELVRGADLVRCPMSAVVVGITDETGALSSVAVTYRDLTERKQFEAELAHTAMHDSLTGLANRQSTFRSLEVSLASGAPSAVLFFDLDDFKDVNDSLGHAVGDEVLRVLGTRIRAASRGTDHVGRLGGDEFLVICRDVLTTQAASLIATKILSAVMAPITIGGRSLVVTGSIGIAMSGGETTSAAELVQDADTAMYRAKRAGRHQAVLFDRSMRVEAVDRLELHRELRLALENNEFVLHFQPLVYFGRDIVQNFEALIRWEHPRLGLLAPMEFLPMVEEVALTGSVGRWVFDAACRAVAAMRRIDPEVCVGVNVHPDQIRQPGFVQDVIGSMDAVGVSGDAIAIESTEHAVMVDVDLTRAVLEELRDLGVSVAIDDFGTGFSNLDLLRRLPVDFLKIDQTFVAGLGVDPSDTQLVRMIIALADELGITTIAEGVETHEQADELQRLGCTIAQGYLYSRPLAFDDAVLVLRAQQASPPSSDKIVPVM